MSGTRKIAVILLGLAATTFGVHLLERDATPHEPSPGTTSSIDRSATSALDPVAAWEEVGRRHYSPFADASMTGANLRIEWEHCIIFVGKYEGVYEPCGCVGGQSGGHAWEVLLRRGIERSVAEPVTTITVGQNVEERGSVVASAIGESYRALNAAYLVEFFGRTGVAGWIVDPSDAAYCGSDVATDIVFVGPGRPITLRGEHGRVIRVFSIDGVHEAPDERMRCDIGVGILHARSKEEAVEAVEAFESQVMCELRVVIDVNNLLVAAGWSPSLHVIQWGMGKGTTVGVLRVGLLQSTVGGGERRRGVDLREMRRYLAVAGNGVDLGTVRDRYGDLEGLCFDWFPATVRHVGEADAASTVALRSLQEARRELLLSSVSDTVGGDETCVECHAAHSKECMQDGHARAMEVLRQKERAEDPSCLRCHSTAFRMGSKLEHNGVTCASCHGVVRVEDGGHARTRAVSPEACSRCHGPFSDPTFNFDEDVRQLGCVRAAGG